MEGMNPNFDPKMKDKILEDNMDYKYNLVKVTTVTYVNLFENF